jgi:hypothetical protein
MRWSFRNPLCRHPQTGNPGDEPGNFASANFASLNLASVSFGSLTYGSVISQTIRLATMMVAMALSVPLVAQNQSPSPNAVGKDVSGMYEFLREGEFLELTVEDEGRVTGFISRYQDLESDHGAFLDHFLEQGKLQSSQLSFRTETVQGVWYEFKGAVDRGPGKSVGDEGYYVLKGALTEHKGEPDGKSAAKPRQVSLKSFPQDADAAPPK